MLNKTIKQAVKSEVGKPYEVEFPVMCPHCGTASAPHFTLAKEVPYTPEIILICTWRQNCCDKHTFTIHRVTTYRGGIGSGEYIFRYPNVIADALPESLCFSTRFIKLYNQAHTAEQSNHLELAGSGYRNALEVLIKDYAIEKLKNPREEVVKKKLHQAIEAYVPTVNLKNCGDVIRILGNDYTHYQRNYESVGFDRFKSYVRIFIEVINTQILMLEPIIELPTQRSVSPEDETETSTA